jgi:hypothetical protein
VKRELKKMLPLRIKSRITLKDKNQQLWLKPQKTKNSFSQAPNQFSQEWLRNLLSLPL